MIYDLTYINDCSKGSPWLKELVDVDISECLYLSICPRNLGNSRISSSKGISSKDWPGILGQICNMSLNVSRYICSNKECLEEGTSAQNIVARSITEIGESDQLLIGLVARRSVLKDQTRSVPKELSRSVLKELSRSVPKEPSRSVPEEPTRLVPKEPSRSVPKELTISVPKEPSRSVPEELTRSVPKEPSRSVLKEPI
nr:hypothetical protein [Tanacetum cinerariifolium]